MNKEFKPIPLEAILDKLYFQLQMASLTGMKSPEDVRRLTSTIYYLEELRKLKNGSKRNGKVSKRTKRQGNGNSSGSEGEG